LFSRLNVFGFPGVEGDGLAAQQKNPGMLDIRFAVEWTRDNIAAFGGVRFSVCLPRFLSAAKTTV